MFLKKAGLAENIYMKKNTLTRFVITIFVGLLFFIMIALTCVNFHHRKVEKQEAQVKERAVETLEKMGYSVELIEEKKFCIEEDGVKNYFYIDHSDVCFDKCEFEVKEEGVKVKEGEILISIRYKDSDNVSVRYDDTRVLIQDDGTEELMYSGSYFVSNTDFDEESLVIDTFIPDDKQKSIDAYNTVMKYTTVEVLKDHYNEALTICKALNE